MTSKQPRYSWMTPRPGVVDDRRQRAMEWIGQAGLMCLMPDRQISARKYRHMLFDREGRLVLTTLNLEDAIDELAARDEASLAMFWPDTGRLCIVTVDYLDLDN